MARTGYSLTSSLALDIKSLLQVFLPPYLMVTTTRQSHRSHRKIKYLQTGSKIGQEQQYPFLSTRGRVLLTPSAGGLEEGKGHRRHTGLLIKIQFKGKLWKTPERAAVVSESTQHFQHLTRSIEKNRRNRHSQPHPLLVVYPRVNSLFPFLHFPPTCRREVGNRKALNPPLPLHQASTLPFLSPESSSSPSDHRRLVAYN